MTGNDQARHGKYLGTDIGNRQVSELVGVARGLIADRELNDREIEFLHRWLISNNAAQANPVIGVILERIRDIYADGFVDEAERDDLADLLQQITANDFEIGELLKSTTLPITDPAPNIDFQGKTFCFTGTFSFGKRSACEAAVKAFGALCVPNLTKSTDYLVIGQYATSAWSQSSFGRKIEFAMELQSNGHPVAIIAEHHWKSYL